MKFLAVVAALAATCYAQSIFITAPAANSTVSPGQSLIVEVDKPVRLTFSMMQARLTHPTQDALTGSTEVALVLSMAPCPSNGCTDPSYDPSGDLGDILYNGPYDPEFHNGMPGVLNKPPYQNLTIEVPTSFTSGEQIALIATHLNLIGVSGQ